MSGDPFPHKASRRTFTILKVTDAWDWIAEAENLLVMSRELRALGHRVVIACARGTLAERARADGFDVRVVPSMHRRKGPIAFLQSASRVRSLVAEIRPDVVHAYRSPPHLMALWALRSHPGLPLVRTRATMVPPRPTFLNRRIHAATARTLVSAEAVRFLCLEAGFAPDSIVVVQGGVDLGRFDPAAVDRAAAKRALGLPADALVVGQLARLAPVKGHVHLLKAARKVIEAVPHARIVLAGPALPGMDEAVRGWATEQGIADRVLLTGQVEDVPATLAAFDVGVVASIGSEAFSRAALEYFAMGLPVVATRVGTLPELVEDGKTGRLVAPQDPDALAAVLIELLQDEAKRRAFGAAARERSTRYGAAAQGARLDAVYRDVLGA